ncbi:hypothetical protein AB7M22_002061 [Pseudomonas sp. ADAK2 TE3594]
MNAWWHEVWVTLQAEFADIGDASQLKRIAPRTTDHSGVTISGGWTVGGSSRGGGLVPGGSCSGTGAGLVGGVGCVGGTVGSSMFGSGVSAGIGMLIATVSSGRWRESCLSWLTHAQVI